MHSLFVLLYIAAALVGFFVLLVVILRWRKLRLDNTRALSRNEVSHAPPPSPYEVSRGVRLLEPGDQIYPRAEPARPRLDPEKPYVFGEPGGPDSDTATLSRSRHDSRWALERSSHRSRFRPGSGKVLLLAGLFVVLLYTVGSYVLHSSKTVTTTTSSSSSTTTTSSSTTTTSPLPTVG